MGERGAQPDLAAGDLHFAVLVSRYNEDVSKRLLRGALEAGVPRPRAAPSAPAGAPGGSATRPGVAAGVQNGAAAPGLVGKGCAQETGLGANRGGVSGSTPHTPPAARIGEPSRGRAAF